MGKACTYIGKHIKSSVENCSKFIRGNKVLRQFYTELFIGLITVCINSSLKQRVLLNFFISLKSIKMIAFHNKLFTIGFVLPVELCNVNKNEMNRTTLVHLLINEMLQKHITHTQQIKTRTFIFVSSKKHYNKRFSPIFQSAFVNELPLAFFSTVHY